MAFNSQVGTLFVDISARGLQGFQSTINSIRSSMSSLTSAGLGSLGGLGGGLAGAGIIGGGAAVAAGVLKASADLDAARRNLRTVFEGTGEEFAKLTAGIDAMATRSPVAVTALYDIAAAAAQAGKEGTKDILEFSAEVAKLAAISNMSADAVTKNLARTQNVFKGSSTAVISNVITAVSNKSAADPGELVTTLGRIAGAAKIAGFSIQETIALAGSLRDIAGGPEVASTSFSKLLGEMVQDPEAFARIAKMSTAAFEEMRKKNPAEALRLTFAEIGKMDDKGQLAALNSLGLEGSRSKNPAAQFITALDRYVKLLAEANSETNKLTATNERFSVIAGGTWKQLEILKNNILLVADAVGSAYLPGINQAVEALGKWLDKNKELVASETIAWVDSFVGGLKQIAEAAGVVFEGLSKIDELVKTIEGKPLASGVAEARAGLANQERIKLAKQMEAAGDNATPEQAAAIRKAINKQIAALGEANIAETGDANKGGNQRQRLELFALRDRIDALEKELKQKAGAAQAGGDFAGGGDFEEALDEAGKAARNFADELKNAKLGNLKLTDPKAFEALKLGIMGGVPEGLFGVNADRFKAFAKDFAAARPDAQGLAPEQIQGIAAARGGKIQAFADQLAEARLKQRAEMKEARFLDPGENMRRLQKAALEGGRDPLIELAKEAKEKMEEQLKAVQEVKDAIDKGVLKVAENGVFLAGGP